MMPYVQLVCNQACTQATVSGLALPLLRRGVFRGHGTGSLEEPSILGIHKDSMPAAGQILHYVMLTASVL